MPWVQCDQQATLEGEQDGDMALDSLGPLPEAPSHAGIEQLSEDAGRRGDKWLSAILNASPDAIIAVDQNQRIQLFSSGAEAIFGYETAEILSRPLELLIPERFKHKHQTHVEEFSESPESGRLMGQRGEIVGLRKDRTEFPAQASISKLDPESEAAFLVILRDITERKEAEGKIRESEDRIRQATRLARLGYSVWDSIEDRCLHCSEEYARIHGLSVAQYIARASTLEGDFSMTHPEDIEAYKAAVRALRSGRQGFEMEYRVITPTDQVRYVREIVKPVVDESGVVVQEFATIQDITETKLAEKKLRRAQRMEAVGQLTGGVAHDFNNLLGVILGNAEFLEDELGNEHAFVGDIKQAALRGKDLTQRLLAYSRRQPLHPQTIALDELVARLTRMLRRTLGETIEIRAESGANLWPALCDPGQLEAALLNLAINARDAMPGGGCLTIACANVCLDETYTATQAEVRPGDYVQITVTDTGEGLSAKALKRAFEPFFTTKDVGKGSGLGLSMVYGFVKQSGGHVTLESRVGAGTTVTLYLPRSEQPITEGERAD